MKKNLLFGGLFFFLSVNIQAQDCQELFISEYLEGFSNNKALEIYNPTDNWVDLSNYFIVRFSNGNASPTIQSAQQLRGSIGPKSVQVGVLDKRDPLGTGQNAPVWDDLAIKADEWYSPVYDENNTYYWNGNDAVALFKGKIPAGTPLAMPVANLTGVTMIDLFGKIGENPGEPNQGGGWTYDGTPAGAGGVVVSADHFLVRKPSVKKGDNVNPVANFVVSQSWDTLSFLTVVLDEFGDTVLNQSGQPAKRMNVDNLGIHICDCGDATGLSEEVIEGPSFSVYPNPVVNGEINFATTDKVTRIVIYDALGKEVKSLSQVKSFMSININVKSGLYFITAYGQRGLRQTQKFIVK